MTQDSRALIRDAFEKAKASGSPDWHRMTVAVLKNRILDLTQGLFKESDHGATTFQDFVRQHGDILELDESSHNRRRKRSANFALEDDRWDSWPVAMQPICTGVPIEPESESSLSGSRVSC